MKHLNFERAKDRFDGIADEWMYEDALTVYNPNWNIRDLVAEMDYLLSTFYDEGHTHYMMIDPIYANEESRKEWRSAVGKIKRFITAYTPFIEGVTCADSHGSKFDNCF